jgi:hypothetical protein
MQIVHLHFSLFGLVMDSVEIIFVAGCFRNKMNFSLLGGKFFKIVYYSFQRRYPTELTRISAM